MNQDQGNEVSKKTNAKTIIIVVAVLAVLGLMYLAASARDSSNEDVIRKSHEIRDKMDAAGGR